MKISNFLKNNIDGGERLPSAEGEIENSIQECCRRKISASVLIDNHSTDFLSIFIDSDSDRKWILLDALVPEIGNKHIKNSLSFEISYHLDNVSYSFESSYIKSKEDKHGTIKISYPKKVKKRQRREYFRVKPSYKAPISILVTTGKEMVLKIEGAMHDISEGGLSFAISSQIADKLEIGAIFTDILFQLPGRGTIKTKGILRNIFKGQGEAYNCGLQFMGMRSDDMDKIYRYVVERQRDTIKELHKAIS